MTVYKSCTFQIYENSQIDAWMKEQSGLGYSLQHVVACGSSSVLIIMVA